jgi:hypothetical protein
MAERVAERRVGPGIEQQRGAAGVAGRGCTVQRGLPKLIGGLVEVGRLRVLLCQQHLQLHGLAAVCGGCYGPPAGRQGFEALIAPTPVILDICKLCRCAVRLEELPEEQQPKL